MKTLLLLLILVWPSVAVELPPQFSSHMVLQRGIRNRIWGKAAVDAKASVFVEFQATLNGKPYSERAESARLRTEQWEVLLPEIDRRVKGGTLTIWEGTSKVAKGGVRVVLQDVLVGDVWVIALPAGKGMKQQPAGAPGLRVLNVADVAALTTPAANGWAEANVMESLDVLAFQFGRALCGVDSSVPQGIVVVPYGDLPPRIMTEAREHALINLIKGAQGEASGILRRTRGSNEHELIQLKHEGKVGAVEFVPPYDLFDFYTRSEKDPHFLNYKGLFAPSSKR